MSEDAGNEYFSDGMSEELLNLLSKIPDMRVISRTSAFSFKEKEITIPAIAEQLNVAYVVEGSVRRAGNQVRITAQLIEADSDSHLWSETYDRELESVFQVQDEIAGAIVISLGDQLGLDLDTTPQARTVTNAEAHDAYLRGRHLLYQEFEGTFEAAISEFQNAIDLDPGFALAHAELALAILSSSELQFRDLDRAEAVDRATPHVKHALALDPELAEAHAASGLLLIYDAYSEDEALQHFDQAIELNPNYSRAYTWKARLLNRTGRYAEAFSAGEKALRLDPIHAPTVYGYVNALANRGRLQEAEREIDKVKNIYPALHQFYKSILPRVRDAEWSADTLTNLDFLLAHPNHHLTRAELGMQFAVLGLEQEALAAAEGRWPGVPGMLGRPGDAVTIMEQRLAEDPGYVRNRYVLADYLAAAGEYARARPILEEMWHRNGRKVTDYGIFRTTNAAALTVILRDAGESSMAEELVAAMRDEVLRKEHAGILRIQFVSSVDFDAGLTELLAGERERGLALIAKAVNDGYFVRPGVAYLQELYDDPGFTMIRAVQKDRQTREREKFLAIVCTDNPYEEIWRPAEGTCEAFGSVAD
jgi:TolB-like protein/tetratricopeptide (TPR) repeat protein